MYARMAWTSSVGRFSISDVLFVVAFCTVAKKKSRPLDSDKWRPFSFFFFLATRSKRLGEPVHRKKKKRARKMCVLTYLCRFFSWHHRLATRNRVEDDLSLGAPPYCRRYQRRESFRLRFAPLFFFVSRFCRTRSSPCRHSFLVAVGQTLAGAISLIRLVCTIEKKKRVRRCLPDTRFAVATARASLDIKDLPPALCLFAQLACQTVCSLQSFGRPFFFLISVGLEP